MVVDFPEPFGPRKPTTSPAGTVSSRPSRARTLPKVLVRPWTSTAGMSYMASSDKGSAGSGAGSRWGGDGLEGAVEHGAIGEQPPGGELPGRQRGPPRGGAG